MFDEMRQREERSVARTEVVAEVEGEIFGPGSVVGRRGAGGGVEEPPGRSPDGVVGVGGFCSIGCHDEDEEQGELRGRHHERDLAWSPIQMRSGQQIIERCIAYMLHLKWNGI